MAPCAPAALVRPRTTEHVSTALAICNRHRQPVVAQGGLTGLAGAAVPRPGDVALSLERLVGVDEIDADASAMTVWAGTTLEAAQQAAAAEGFELTYDLGARGSCTVGGNIATNAGGNRVIRYGMTREHMLGLEAVLADGTIVTSLNKMFKNNTGYDLKQFFIGSEGTLGVVTRAVLRLRPAPRSRTTALLALPRRTTAVLALLATRNPSRRGNHRVRGDVAAVLRMLAERARDHPAGRHRRRVGVLVEMPAPSGPDEEAVEQLIGETIEHGWVTDAFLARSTRDTEAIWGMREAGPLDGDLRLVPLRHRTADRCDRRLRRRL